MLKLVLLDMDGVIFEGKNFWLDFHHLMGTERQAWQLWEGLAGRDYPRLSQLTARRLWAGRPAAPFFEMINARRTVHGIAQVLSFLQEQGIATAVVSSGPYQLAERARRLFHIDAIRANRLAIDSDNHFTGDVDVQVDDNAKAQAALELMTCFGAVRETTAVIGDAASDAGMAALAGLSIAYDTQDAAMVSASQHRLPYGRLADAIGLLQAYAAAERLDAIC